MKRQAFRIVAAAGLLALGRTAGRAQTAAPDFELIVNARAGRMATFTFECTGQLRCESGRIGGWLKP